jgi:hypothetical protein
MYKFKECAKTESAVRRARYELTEIPASAVQPREGYVYRKRQASYRVVKVNPHIGWIVDLDLDGAPSVTNDAERVVAELAATYAERRIIYQDADGIWGELLHRGQVFLGFALAPELAL